MPFRLADVPQKLGHCLLPYSIQRSTKISYPFGPIAVSCESECYLVWLRADKHGSDRVSHKHSTSRVTVAFQKKKCTVEAAHVSPPLTQDSRTRLPVSVSLTDKLPRFLQKCSLEKCVSDNTGPEMFSTH
jgi:hypothetical protein